MIDNDSKQGAWDDEELHTERVMVTVISGLELSVDEVNSGECRDEKEDLHGRVI